MRTKARPILHVRIVNSAGDLPRSIALIDAAADVTDSQFARPTSREA